MGHSALGGVISSTGFATRVARLEGGSFLTLSILSPCLFGVTRLEGGPVIYLGLGVTRLEGGPARMLRSLCAVVSRLQRLCVKASILCLLLLLDRLQ